ncbi:MAG TPA: hypothetical protein VN841_09875 [Bryobacteraceae bacterium]|nr:hypothetical protein [Bryobacteraceae bacterium]
MRFVVCTALGAVLAAAQIQPDRHDLPGASRPGGTSSGGAAQQPGGGRVPAGFNVAARSGNIGQALTASFAAGPSAKAAFKAALRQASGYFDRAPALLSGAADAADTQVQVSFRASFNNTPIAGLLQVTTANGKASAMLFFDRQDQLRQSLPVMAKQVAATAPKAPGGGAPERPQIVRTPLSDNSGFIGLAPGWKITGAYKGTVDAQGPNGEFLSLGGYQQVFPRGNYPKMINGPYLQPWPAFMAYEDALLDHKLRQGQGSIRLIEQAPTQGSPGQQAAYLSYEVAVAGQKYRGLAMVITAPLHDDLGSWFFYLSLVGAPSDRYAQALPTLLEMWKSWSVNQSVFRERMESALKSMRETTRLIQEANAYRQHVFDNTNFAWDETIRGVTMIEDTVTRERGEVDTNYAQGVVDEANRQGYQWRIVPIGELVP